MTGNGYGVDEYGVGVYGLLSEGGGNQIVLDPPEVAEGRVALILTSGEIRVAEEGPDWGEAALEAFMAEMEIGQVPADVRWPNRIVRIPLLLGAVGPSFEAFRADLQRKVALFQREGGWVKRDNLYADVVNASLTMPDKWGWRGLEPEVILTLECIPDFYGDEVTLTSHIEVANPTLIFTESGIPGDMPGRVAIALNEFQGFAQRGVIWGWRSRHYSAADTAQLRYRAQDMDPLGAATVTALSGSASGSVVRHPGIGNFNTPILGTDITDGPLDHTGSYRVLARVHTASPLGLLPDNVRVRLVWDVGDYTNPTENATWTIPSNNNFYVADLGEIRLDAAPIGEHRWVGQIQGWCLSGGNADISIDEVWFVPIDEGTGLLRASVADATGAFTAFSALGLADTSETGGLLNGKTMNTGGSWATSGDPTDFTVVADAAGSYAYRQTVSDTSDVGRLALAGTGTAGPLINGVLFQWSVVQAGGSPVAMVYQRWADDTHNLHARYFVSLDGLAGFVFVYMRNGGGFVELGRALVEPVDANQISHLRMATDTTGAVFVWVGPVSEAQGGALGSPDLVTSHPALAAGGALASGRYGFREYYSLAAPVVTRLYSWHAAWPGQADAVMHAGRALEIRTDGVFREAIDVTRFGEVQDVEGDLPRVPVAGLEGRATELFVKATRGDFDELPDSGVDNIVGTLRFRPSWIFPR